jgi:molybdate transport system substrate-binding protein
MIRKVATLVLLLISAAGFSSAEQISVAAAADLNHVMRDLAAGYEKQAGVSLALTFGASGNLYSQIQSGAPFDLFFSADSDYPQKLAAAGRLDPRSLRTYAVGHLVLWVANASGLDPQELKLRLVRSVQKLAIANPEHAPYGRAAVAALRHYGMEGEVRDRLVMGESVSQAAQFAHSGNAQAALIPESLAVSPAMKSAGKYWVVPADAYPEIRQTVGIVAASKHKQAAQSFIDFVTSSQGLAILQNDGLSIPVQR